MFSALVSSDVNGCLLETGDHQDRIESELPRRTSDRVTCPSVPTYSVTHEALEPLKLLNARAKALLTKAIKKGIKDNLVDSATVEHFRLKGKDSD